MPKLKRWFDRARTLVAETAEEHLPPDVLEVGKRLRSTVIEHAPASVRDALERHLPAHDSAAAATAEAGPASEDKSHFAATKAEDPDDAPVVVYATLAEAESVANIREIFRRNDVRVREIDLDAFPQMGRQIAGDTGVFVPPYVFIGGRFWGAEFDIVSLEAEGDLLKVVEGRLDQISEQARRIGRIHDTFSDELTAENIVDRLRRGHILCIDDLDCWYEHDKAGERFYYQGGVLPIEQLATVAEEIARAAEADEIEAQWRFEPEVSLG